jgi:hypothetical protein
MKFGFNAFGYRAEVELSILQKATLLNVQVQALDSPALAKVTVTVATISIVLGISKIIGA